MKVSLICPSYSQGLQDYTFSLSRGLASKEIDFQVLVNDSFSWSNEALDIKNVFKGTRPKMAVDLVRQLNSYEPDVVHSQTTNLPLLILLMILREALDFKLVLTPHSSKSHWNRPLYDQFQVKIYNGCDGIIWHTKQDRERMKTAGVETNQVVIPHGNYNIYSEISEEAGSGKPRERLGLPENDILFLFFGYIRQDKRLDLLLTSFAALDENTRKKASIVIAGEPVTEFNEYEEMVSRYGIEDDVYSWPHFIDDECLPLFFRAADVIVTPYNTISESGIVHIAFGFGKPVIATETEGFQERLEHGKNGILVEPDSIPELQEALKFAINNESHMTEFGKTNKNISVENSWETIAEKTVEFYSRIR